MTYVSFRKRNGTQAVPYKMQKNLTANKTLSLSGFSFCIRANWRKIAVSDGRFAKKTPRLFPLCNIAAFLAQRD